MFGKSSRFAACVLLVFPAAAAERSHAVVVDQAETQYTIRVDGTMDPENLSIEMENLGNQASVNPRLTVNGRYDWFDAKSMADEITRGAATDEEKALSIWWWVLYKRFQRSPADRSALHPVRAMNGYGYGICGHTSAWMKTLLTAAGLKARVQELWGHTVSEAYYDGAWHMLDGNVKVFYLNRDNRTIASLAELEKDRWLIERAIHPRDPWFRGPDPAGRNSEIANYLVTARDNFEEHGYDGEIEREYTMSMKLKPGERLIRWWKPVLGKFEGRDKRAEVPEVYANGQSIWEPDLTRIDLHDYIRADDNVTTRGQDGRGPAVHVAELQDRDHTRPSRFRIPIESAYPIVGGRLWCTLVKEGGSDLDQAAVFYGDPGWGPGNLYTYRWQTGPKTVELDLDANILRQGAVYRYNIGFNLRGNGKATPPTQSGLDGIKVVSDLQVSPHSLPALSLGENVVRFRQQAPAKVRITHRWREITDRRPPGVVRSAEAAPPRLSWQAAADAADYQVMICGQAECRYPLSPALWQNVGSAATAWKVPDSYLNPGTTYYWKVRARSSRGDVGAWSPVFSFRTGG